MRHVALIGMFICLTVLTCNAGQYEVKGQCTEVFIHTFDEVFQAAQEMIEREGEFVVNLDKAKGTMSMTNHYLDEQLNSQQIEGDILIEPVSGRSETRVTITVHFTIKVKPHSKDGGDHICRDWQSKLQKVLATYR